MPGFSSLLIISSNCLHIVSVYTIKGISVTTKHRSSVSKDITDLNLQANPAPFFWLSLTSSAFNNTAPVGKSGIQIISSSFIFLSHNNLINASFTSFKLYAGIEHEAPTPIP